MPIENDSSNIDFIWNFEGEENQQDVSLSVRLHKTKEFGWTISFLDSDRNPETSVPAILFKEVWEHVQSHVAPKQSAVVLNKPPGYRGSLGLPQIGRSASEPSKATEQPQAAPETPQRQEIADAIDSISSEDPVFESFTLSNNEESLLKEGNSIHEELEAASSVEGHGVDDLEDKESALAERQAAMERAKAKKKGIKKRHTEKQETDE